MSLQEVWEGWRNHLLPPEHLREAIISTAKERLAVCKRCEHSSQNARRRGYHSLRPDIHCTICGCNLLSKTKCLSCYCPIGRWGSVVSEGEESEMKITMKEED